MEKWRKERHDREKRHYNDDNYMSWFCPFLLSYLMCVSNWNTNLVFCHSFVSQEQSSFLTNSWSRLRKWGEDDSSCCCLLSKCNTAERDEHIKDIAMINSVLFISFETLIINSPCSQRTGMKILNQMPWHIDIFLLGRKERREEE